MREMGNSILLGCDMWFMSQPGSCLIYVGGITGFESAKKLLYPWDITILSALVRIMIFQHIEIM